MSGARFIYPLRFYIAEGREGVHEDTIRVGEGRGSVLSSSGEMSKLRARFTPPPHSMPDRPDAKNSSGPATAFCGILASARRFGCSRSLAPKLCLSMDGDASEPVSRDVLH